MPDLFSRPPPAPPSPAPDARREVISVSTLNRLARQRLEAAFPLCWVGGEISNLTLAASGHAYFSLKDAQAQARCVMFRNRVQTLGFRLENGLQVEARVLVSLYEPRGDFQLNVEGLRRAGQGDLYERFLQLKARLEAEGLFAAGRKRPLPPHPRTLGIVTSLQAAALRDVLTTLGRRAPHLRVVVYPSLVQGEEAPRQLVAALEAAAGRREADVLLLVRGGGSIEDLWAFNDEAVARAIAACPMPVISGVGHETDFTIADFAADLRAPTPTAAAELASPDREALRGQLERLALQFSRRLRRRLEDAGQRLDWAARRLKHPAERLALQRQNLHALEQRLQHALGRRLERAGFDLERARQRLRLARPQPSARAARLEALQRRLGNAQQRALQTRRSQLERLAAGLTHLNPEAVLSRGYAIVFDSAGQAVREAAALAPEQPLTLRLHRGERAVRVSGEES